MDKSSTTSKQPKLSRLIVRFSSGAAVGLAIAATYWFNAAYFGHSLMLERAVVGSLITVIICGLLAAKFDGRFWQVIESLLPLIP